MTRNNERDESIDTLLRSGLGHPASDERPEECLDPEVLAAWTEGRLPPTDAARVETHLASCASCQEVLAVFARTEPSPAGPSSTVWQHAWCPASADWLAPPMGHPDRSRCDSCGNLGCDSQGSRRRRVRTHGRLGDFGIGAAGAEARQRPTLLSTTSTPGKGRASGATSEATSKQPRKQHCAAMPQPPRHKRRQSERARRERQRLGTQRRRRAGRAGPGQKGGGASSGCRRRTRRSRACHSRGACPGTGRDPAACRSAERPAASGTSGTCDRSRLAGPARSLANPAPHVGSSVQQTVARRGSRCRSRSQSI